MKSDIGAHLANYSCKQIDSQNSFVKYNPKKISRKSIKLYCDKQKIFNQIPLKILKVRMLATNPIHLKSNTHFTSSIERQFRKLENLDEIKIYSRQFILLFSICFRNYYIFKIFFSAHITE